jgi:hypothetical protein
MGTKSPTTGNALLCGLERVWVEFRQSCLAPVDTVQYDHVSFVCSRRV